MPGQRRPYYSGSSATVAPAPATATASESSMDDGQASNLTAPPNDSATISPPHHSLGGFIIETIAGLQCCCSVGSVRNGDGSWTELLLLAIDAQGSLVHDAMGQIEPDSLLSGGLQLGTLQWDVQDASDGGASEEVFRCLSLSDDRALCPADLQCHAVDEAGAPLLSQDRFVRVNSMCVRALVQQFGPVTCDV